MITSKDVFDASEIGKRIKQVREALGYTQPFIAKLCGMSPQAWNNNECGRDRMSLEPALRLCAATGATLDWIYRALAAGMPPELLKPPVKRAPQRSSRRKPSTSSRAKARTSSHSSSSTSAGS